MKVKTLLLSISLLFSSLCFSQQSKHTISGTITDAASGEVLIGATVHEKTRLIGTSANPYGFYSLTLGSDSVTLVYSYVGYEKVERSFAMDRDHSFSVSLTSSTLLQEVVITGQESIQERSDMSTIELDMDMVNSLPVLLGERDLLKTIQLLPGVQSGSEGSSGLYVRGGGPDQNLILLDGVPIYNASHLFGFFSVFNTDAISNVELVKGGFPARYGGRLSSVLDIRMKEGNMQELHGEGGIGLISSRLTLEGPIKKDKTSFLFSGRRTYIDILAQPFIRAANEGDETGGYFFYDANAKVNHIIDDKNRIFLSGYFGNDKAYARFSDSFSDITEKTRARLAWGNAIVSSRWNRIISPKLFANATATMSNYRFVTGIELETSGGGLPDITQSYEYRSGILDFGLKVDFDYLPSPDHYVKTGTGYTYHTFSPGVSETKGFEDDIIIGSNKVYANEFYGFIEDDWKVNERIKINGGLRISGFNVSSKTYFGLEPRLSGRYLINDDMSIKASYSHMQQYLHLLTNGSVGLPTDLWVPVTGRIKPQISDQVAAGIARTINKDYELSVESYYKWMTGLIEYKDGASFTGTAEDWQNKVATGDGTAYGIEVLFRKRYGKLNGWIGYTLSWSNRQFDELNFGREFSYKFDRRHDIGLALNYKINENVDMGLVWVYGTGNSLSLPVARHQPLPFDPISPNQFYSNDIEYIDERNGYRMPSYHRLDLGINFKKQMKKHERVWSFGIYNIYNRQNPFFLYFGSDNEGNRKLKQSSLFPIIPSFTYNFKF
jgi:hypothetical protein